MPQKEKNRLLWEQVRQEDDLVKAVHMIADLTEQAIDERICEFLDVRNQMSKYREEARLENRELRKVLLGNGDPSHSVVARLERIEESQKKQTENSSKVMWTVISAIVVQIVMYLLKVL